LSATKTINASAPRLRRQFALMAKLLFQRSADGSELGTEPGADSVHDGDDHHRNAGCDQPVFDRRRAGFVGDKSCRIFFIFTALGRFRK
jgi:hypothetical protein